ALAGGRPNAPSPGAASPPERATTKAATARPVASGLGAIDLLSEVVLGADLLDLVELGLQPVDVLLLAPQDLFEEGARAVVALGPGQLDPRVQTRHRVVLELQIVLMLLGNGLPHHDLHVLLHVGCALEVED